MMRAYFDHNATTPIHPTVLQAMLPYLTERFGNPSSIHIWGQEARQALENARRTVAVALGTNGKDSVVFTGSGTEADNLALKGVLEARADGHRHLIVSTAEHHAILHVADYLERRGCGVTRLQVDPDGLLDPEDVRRAIRPETVLVSLMHSNNETGVLFPVGEVARICRERDVLLHTDAVQSFGKVPLDIDTLGADLVSVSAHKIHGPKGIGALYVRRGTKMLPLLHGGWQERSRRGGTENVAGAVALACAAELMHRDLEDTGRRLGSLRDRLEAGLMAAVPGTLRNGHSVRRLPNTSNLSFPGIDAESLIVALDLQGIGVSSGAACSSGSLEPSHVLSAMGFRRERVSGSIRFSLGRGTTSEEIDYVLEALPPIVERVRQANGRVGAGVRRGA
jgi:cysteine desulfurase